MLTALADGIRAADPGLLRSTWGSDLGDTLPAMLESLVCFQDIKGLSPLHLACIKGHPEAAGVLMELGANPFAVVRVVRVSVGRVLGGPSWGVRRVRAVRGGAWGNASCVWDFSGRDG